MSDILDILAALMIKVSVLEHDVKYMQSRLDAITDVQRRTIGDGIFDQTCGCDQDTALRNGSPW